MKRTKTKDTAEEAAAHSAATGQPAEGGGKGGRFGVGGADCRGDATAGPGASGPRHP